MSESEGNTQIDPAFIDPAMAWFATGMPTPEADIDEGLPPANAQSDDDDGFPPSPMAGSSGHDHGPALPSATPLTVNFHEIGRMVKKRMHLTPESSADLDRFCAASNPADHIVMVYAQGLELRDLLKSRQVDEEWKPSEQLKKTLKKYAHAFVLSPTATSYRGNATKHILEALRELTISHLPPAEEDAQVQVVYAMLSKHLTTYRNQVKKAIQASVENSSSDVRNIAALAHSLVKKTGVQVTLQLYMRLAFLRWHVVQYPDEKEDGFWLKVDETLSKWRTSGKTEVELTHAFNAMYEQDKCKYGEPDTSFKTTSIAEIDRWQRVLNVHAGKVVGGAEQKGVKRKRVD